MRPLFVICLFPLFAAGQAEMAPGLLRGVLLERDTTAPAGEFSVRAPDSRVYRFRYDEKTYIERDSQNIRVPALSPGDTVEVVADPAPVTVLRYARTVHVLPPERPLQATPRPRPRNRPVPMYDPLAPTGNLTYSGVISVLNPKSLTLRTRHSGSQTILFRQDTRFLEDGNVVDVSALSLNMRVFVRAGKNIYNEVEAYQVVWGNILTPQ